eukprot:Em0007g573a
MRAPVQSVVAASGDKLELVGQACCQMYIPASALDKREQGAVLLEPLDTFMEDYGLLVAQSLSQDVRVGMIRPVTDADIVCSIESPKSNRHSAGWSNKKAERKFRTRGFWLNHLDASTTFLSTTFKNE